MVCPDLSISCNNPRAHDLFIGWGFSAYQFWAATCHFILFRGVEMNVNAGHGVSEGCIFSFDGCAFCPHLMQLGEYDDKWCYQRYYQNMMREQGTCCLSSCGLGVFYPSFIVHSLNLGLHDVCLMRRTTVQAHFVAVLNRLVNIKRSDTVDFSRWFCNKSACYSGSNWWVFNPTMKSNEIW